MWEKVKSMVKSKQGQQNVFDQIGGLGIGVAALAVTMIVVFLLLANLAANTDVVADGNASAAVSTLTGAAEDIPGWVPLVVLAFIGAILLSLVALFRSR